MSSYITLVAAIGFLLSLYATYGFYRSANDPHYKTICDLSDKASCTKAFQSDFGIHFGIPNGFWGMGFYGLFIGLHLQGYEQFLFPLAILSSLASIYLGYILATEIKAVCLDCIAVYIVNFTLLILTGIPYFS